MCVPDVWISKDGQSFTVRRKGVEWEVWMGSSPSGSWKWIATVIDELENRVISGYGDTIFAVLEDGERRLKECRAGEENK